MTKSIAQHATAATAVAAIAAGTAVAAPAPARASGFAAAYTCSIPVLGTRHVTIHGSLTASPASAEPGRPVRFRLRITRLSLMSPVPIDSWSAVAGIAVSGPRRGGFRMTGSGGSIAPRRPVSGDLYGTWTPRARGTYRFRGGDVVISTRVARLGLLSVTCAPRSPRPVLETVAVRDDAAGTPDV